jgi:lysophospholipase L1-like esterase
VVVYGTSIVQGGCASRTGMAYPAIVGRKLDWPMINLGFSGNGKTEPEMAALLAELDPAVYVLDSLPNLRPAEVGERVEPFIRVLRKAHPTTPIVLVENVAYTNAEFVESRRRSYTEKNAALRKIYEKLIAEGDRNLHYIPTAELLGDDGEGTVDGTHPTDLGFLRMSEPLVRVLRPLLEGAPR